MLTESIGTFPNPFRIRRLGRLLRHEGVQLVCVNLDRELRTLAPAARSASSSIRVVRRRGSDLPLGNGIRQRFTYSRLVDGLLVNSEATMRTILSASPWLDERRVRMIHNGIATDVFRPDAAAGHSARERLGVGENDFLVGTIGSVVRRKDHPTIIRACGRLSKASPSRRPRLLIAGRMTDSSYGRELEDLAGSLGMNEKDVIYTGELGAKDLPACYNALDAFVLASTSEGFGYALAEAMSSGVPSLASSASSLPEVIGGGEESVASSSGLLFPVGDDRALAAALSRLSDDPELARSLAERGRRRVELEFSLDRVTESLIEWFEHLIDTGETQMMEGGG